MTQAQYSCGFQRPMLGCEVDLFFLYSKDLVFSIFYCIFAALNKMTDFYIFAPTTTVHNQLYIKEHDKKTFISIASDMLMLHSD